MAVFVQDDVYIDFRVFSKMMRQVYRCIGVCTMKLENSMMCRAYFHARACRISALSDDFPARSSPTSLDTVLSDRYRILCKQAMEDYPPSVE